uniref:Uncharacterized protein n=1 Tax=viral metagenome TaxID=1070528 RepID=A0A6C0L0B4_9ZZZZ|tara:strand:- start:23280 stop:23744 length:465 start_codon:yes stop_codon:yes gene_type:complete
MEKTTNISELPINSNIPPIDTSEMEDKIHVSTEKFTIDQDVVHSQPEKRVKFADEEETRKVVTPDTNEKKQSDLFTISNELKLIALASLMFFIFIDNKFKRYIINILTQVFGEFIKTETGGTSKVGNLFYSLTFGLVLYLFTIFVDYTTLQFDF